MFLLNTKEQYKITLTRPYVGTGALFLSPSPIDLGILPVTVVPSAVVSESDILF